MNPIRHPITKHQTDTIHILGNGYSLDLFNRGDWSDDHWFVGCNFSNPLLRPDYTVIMDAKPIMKFYAGYKLTIPAVISSRCESYIISDKGGWHKLADDSFIVVDIIDMIHEKDKKFPMNSGQHATVYSIEKNTETVKTVHLWGFDSFWKNDISSKTDETIPRIRIPQKSDTVISTWKSYWDQIFQKYNTVDFQIHGNTIEAS